jgi:Glycosyl Hydrolase Family 88
MYMMQQRQRCQHHSISIWFLVWCCCYYCDSLFVIPTVTHVAAAAAVVPSSSSSDNTTSSTELATPSIVQSLLTGFIQCLDQGPLFPGFSGYCGWNYDSAVAIHAFLLDEFLNLGTYQNETANNTLAPKIQRFLTAGTAFPQPGSRINTAPFFFTPGDRIGLFGALYFNYTGSNFITRLKANKIVNVVENRLLNWNMENGVFARPFGWNGLVSIRNLLNLINSAWVNALDSFAGGYPLVYNYPDKLSDILRSYNTVLRDPNDGLWYHGANVNKNDGSVTPNGVKWGRANGWILLSMATFLIRTDDNVPGREEIINIFLGQISNLVQYQRGSGAFGNIVNSDMSPDESSLTTVYVFAVGTAVHLKLLPYSSMEVLAAEKAWTWLERRTVIGLTVSDTCSGQELQLDPNEYDGGVGQSSGAAVALFLFAALGHRMLDLASSAV